MALAVLLFPSCILHNHIHTSLIYFSASLSVQVPELYPLGDVPSDLRIHPLLLDLPDPVGPRRVHEERNPGGVDGGQMGVQIGLQERWQGGKEWDHSSTPEGRRSRSWLDWNSGDMQCRSLDRKSMFPSPPQVVTTDSLNSSWGCDYGLPQFKLCCLIIRGHKLSMKL